ncbi:MAG TPA: lysophospholipid acyltransferase family protein [Rudaea sp.]|nr:lysophospholipid acyltransferase family protein [Rudaea sp.]
MSAPVFPVVPPNAPQLAPSAGAALCRWLFARAGWRVAGELPDVVKLVVIAAPHSSNWDAVLALLVKVGLRIEVRFIGKREAFFWPLGWLLRRLGGIPIDRRHAHNVVKDVAGLFGSTEKLWFAVAPEGTRKKVKEWKSGFWRIARAANVPILQVYFHYPEKTIGFGPLLYPSDDMDADMAKIREFYRPWQGRNRGIE